MKQLLGSLTGKLFMISFLVVLAGFTSVTQLAYTYIRSEVRSNNEYYTLQILSKVDQYLNLSFSALQTVLFSAESIYQSGNPSDEFVKRRLSKLYDLNVDYIKNIYIIRNDLSIVGGSPLSAVFDEPLEERRDFFEQVQAKPGTLTYGPYVSKYSGWTVTLVKAVPGAEPPAAIALDIDLRSVEYTLFRLNRDDLMNIAILSSTGKVVAGVPEVIGDFNKSEHTFRLGGITSGDIGQRTDSEMGVELDSGETMSLQLLKSANFPWTTVIINKEYFLQKSYQKIKKYYGWLITLSVLLSTLIAAIVSRYIRKPLHYLMGKMKQIQMGNLHVQIDLRRDDEFGILAKTFESMLTQIKANTELKRRLELQVLHAQINPHFLYNTLGSISNVVGLEKYECVDPIIESLIRILEYGIADPDQKVSLEEELTNVRDYIFIQNVRYQKNFTVVESIAEELAFLPVFRMMLQPIVENSLFHGYNGGRIEGEIHINAYGMEGMIVIDIVDHGTGMTEDELKLLLTDNRDPAPKRRRIGLINIHQRIRLYDGENYGLRIFSKPGEGTTVRLLLRDSQNNGEVGT